MADKRITLEMTVLEEDALARLLKYFCYTETSDSMHGQLSRILGEGSCDIEQITRINAALNAVR
jgi:hypothetical protein